MRLLIITQKVDKNDGNLGFFHRWILEFAKHYEFITVIALYVGEYDLPENVRVFSLGKEKIVKGATLRSSGAKRKSGKKSFLARFGYIFNFYKYIWSERKNYDAVFVHMNQVYILLGGLFWRTCRKKISLWYAHGGVSFGLRIAEIFSNNVFTSTASGFRLKSKKIKIVGQGIDAQQFENQNLKVKSDNIDILHTGRITRSKNIHLFVNVAEILKKNRAQFQINMIGGPITEEDKRYLKKLEKDILDKGLTKYFNFIGAVTPSKARSYYKENDIFINLSDTGSMDKVVLEAMVSGMRILVSNEAFADILPPENKTIKDPEQIAKDIIEIANTVPNPSLREYVLKEHNLTNLIEKIVKTY